MQYNAMSTFRQQKLNKERLQQEIKLMNSKRYVQWSCLVFSSGLALGVLISLTYLLKVQS